MTSSCSFVRGPGGIVYQCFHCTSLGSAGVGKRFNSGIPPVWTSFSYRTRTFYPYKYMALASGCLGRRNKQRLLLQAAAPLYSRQPVVPCQILTHRRRIARMLKWEALIPVTKLNWRGWDISRSSSAFDLTYPSSWRSPATRRDLTLLQVR